MELLKEIKELNNIELQIKTLKESVQKQLMIEGVEDPGIFKCVFTGGGPASGKSYMVDEIFGLTHNLKQSFAQSGLKVINSDSAFELLLKKNGINPKELGKIEDEDPELWDSIMKNIRPKARTITNKIKSFYEEGRLGMIIDGTGDEVMKIQKQKEHAESLGYDCYMVFVNTSLEVALARNRQRERTLSDNLVTTIWKDCQNNLGAFQTMFGGNFRIVDNTEYAPVSKSVLKATAEFIRKPITNPIAKKWIATAKALKQANLIK